MLSVLLVNSLIVKKFTCSKFVPFLAQVETGTGTNPARISAYTVLVLCGICPLVLRVDLVGFRAHCLLHVPTKPNMSCVRVH